MKEIDDSEIVRQKLEFVAPSATAKTAEGRIFEAMWQSAEQECERLRADRDACAEGMATLDAENFKLRAHLDALSASLQGGITERDKLRAQRDALLAAAKPVVQRYLGSTAKIIVDLDAAIREAGG